MAGLGGLTIFLLVRLVGFLQPVLLPFALAAILAYLLEPVVAFLCRKGLSRTTGTLVVFFLFFLVATGVLLSVVPTAYRQGGEFIKNFPAYSTEAKNLGIRTMSSLEAMLHSRGLSETDGEKEVGFVAENVAAALTSTMEWLQQKLPDLLVGAGDLLTRSIGGFFGAFGLLIGFILVPVFLFFLLRDAPAIGKQWADFLPLKHSPLKTELVSLLLEINQYIIAFFRGQVLVGVINGTLIAIGLLIMGMDFAILIGLLVATLGIIPYAGTILTWGPAVLIAAAQFGDWTHPLIVTAIFLGVNQLESLFISPWIVGDSVGLHPLTVILAVLMWTVILGGLIGALLAVPLTAALKVIARRYLWDRQRAASASPPPDPGGGSPPGPIRESVPA